MIPRLGRYETLRAIASGGMATVHLARALGAGGFERLVAIKVMHPHLATDPDFVAMFLDEARLAARVRHPNVVATIDVEEDPLFLVMEYIDGPSLFDVMRRMFKTQASLPLDVALRIFLDTLAGLHAAHDLLGADGAALQLVHRDVSPQNVLVGADGIARITDFGVARAESRLSSTRGGQLKGKIAYMAPEQILSEPVDRRSDIYAASVVLWEMLTGRRLFRGDNDGALVAQILTGASKSPHEVRPTVPEPIAMACVRALQRAPDGRYATAAEFAEAIEDAANEAAVGIAPPRVVAAFIKELAIHKGLDDLPPAPSSAPGSSTSKARLKTPAGAPTDGAPDARETVRPGGGQSPRSEEETLTAPVPGAPISSDAPQRDAAANSGNAAALGAAANSGSAAALDGAPRSGNAASLSGAPQSGNATGSGTAAALDGAAESEKAAGLEEIASAPSSTHVSAVVPMEPRPRPILGAPGMLITAVVVAAAAGALFLATRREEAPRAPPAAASLARATESIASAPGEAAAIPSAPASAGAGAPSEAAPATTDHAPATIDRAPATTDRAPSERAQPPGSSSPVSANPRPGKGPGGKPTPPRIAKTAPSPTTFRPPDL